MNDSNSANGPVLGVASSTNAAWRGPDCLEELLVELVGRPLAADAAILRTWLDAIGEILAALPDGPGYRRHRWVGLAADRLIRDGFAAPEARASLGRELARLIGLRHSIAAAQVKT